MPRPGAFALLTNSFNQSLMSNKWRGDFPAVLDRDFSQWEGQRCVGEAVERAGRDVCEDDSHTPFGSGATSGTGEEGELQHVAL